MNKIKYLLVMLILFPVFVFAEDYKYNITDNEIYIEVDQNKIYYTENTTIDFKESNVQVTRNITKDMNNFEVNSNYIIDSNSIKINSRSKDTYSYISKYNSPKKNENKYTITIQNGYEVPLNSTSFSIEVLGKIDKGNIHIEYKDKDITKDTILNISGNRIIGELKEPLNPGEEVNITIDYTKIIISPITAFSLLFPIGCCILSYIMWYLYGKDLKTKVSETANLPRTINPIDVALISNEKIVEEDVYNLLIYLANKGYITIEENDKHEFTLTRNKDYNGKDYRESLFIKNLFKKEKTVSLSDYINAVYERKDTIKYELIDTIHNDEISRRFHKTSDKIINLSYTDSEKSKYFEDSAESLKKTLILMITLILVTITSIPFIEINKLYLLPLSVAFSIFILKILLEFVGSINFRKLRFIDIASIVIIVVVIALIMMIPSFARSKVYYITFLVSSVSVTIILILYKYMPKRTIYGSRLLGKIDGLKEFILNCKDVELERVLELNPNYLYDIYPYARTLGIEKEVLNKMKKVNIEKPEWLIIKDYTPIKFYNAINRLSKKIKEEGELR